MQPNPYLTFNGQCEAAFKFYAQTLGGKIEAMLPPEDTPASDHVLPGWRKKILHARFNVSGQVLMGADCPPDGYEQPKGFSVSLQIKDPVEAERIFHLLAENGKAQMPIQKTFWVPALPCSSIDSASRG